MPKDTFEVGERVLIAPDFSNDGFMPFEATIDRIERDGDTDPNPMIHVKDGDGNETFWMLGNVRKLTVPKTKDEVRHNFNPDEHEVNVRRAIHVLSDFSTEIDVILMADDKLHVYLNAFILGDDMEDDESIVNGEKVVTERPKGTVEYMVCDGLPGQRSHGNSFYNLKEAIAHFNEVVKTGGWKKFFNQHHLRFETEAERAAAINCAEGKLNWTIQPNLVLTLNGSFLKYNRLLKRFKDSNIKFKETDINGN
jgi:hypothetical protein